MDENNKGAMALALGALGALAWQIISGVLAEQGTELANAAINEAKNKAKEGKKKGKK